MEHREWASWQGMRNAGEGKGGGPGRYARLAMAVAAIALLGAVFAAPAMAGTGFEERGFGEDEIGVQLNGEEIGSQYLSTEVGAMSCSGGAFHSGYFEGSVAGLLTSSAADWSCYLGGSKAMQMNGCGFTLEPGVEVAQDEFEGTVAIGPAGCGPIEMEWWLGIKCLEIPSQSGLAARYWNEEGGGKSTVRVEVQAEGLKHSLTGYCGSGSYESGSWAGEWEIEGESEASEPIDVVASDQLPATFRSEATSTTLAASPQGDQVLHMRGVEIACEELGLSSGAIEGIAAEAVTVDPIYGDAEGGPCLMRVPLFEAEGYPVTLAGSAPTTLGTSLGEVSCEETALQGQISSATLKLTLGAEFDECHTTGWEFPTTVDTNSCQVTLRVENLAPPHLGKLGVFCEEEGDAIEYNVYNASETLLCKARVGPQKDHKGFQLSNVGEGSGRTIALEDEVEGLEYEYAGGTLCPESEARSDGTLSGALSLEGTGESEAQVGTYISGPEAGATFQTYVEPGGCGYRFELSSGESGVDYSTPEVVCEGEGESIELKLEFAGSKLSCAEIPPQSSGGYASFASQGAAEGRQIDSALHLEGFEYTLLGACADKSGESRADGAYDGEATLSGEDEAQEAVGVWVDPPARPPDTIITSGPSGKVLPDVSFSFKAKAAGGESTFKCQLDEGAFEACSKPKSYQGLPEGPHTFRVKARFPWEEEDETPAERSFEVYDPPETTITSPKPSYSAGAPSAEFTSDEEGSSFECKLDSGSWTSCTSPHAIAVNPGDTEFHDFYVAATDSVGNKDASPAHWQFNVGPYPAARTGDRLMFPEEGFRTVRYVTLKAKWLDRSYGESWARLDQVSFQLKLAGWEAFKTIPSKYLLDGQGEEAEMPIPIEEEPGHSAPVFFDVVAYGGSKGISSKELEEGIKFRAAYDGGKNRAGASKPINVEFSRYWSAADATEAIGPAALDLLSGQYTISRTDVSIPVPGFESNLEFTRVYDSAYATREKTNVKVLSPMWQPSAPVEAEYEEEAWQKILVQHRDEVPAVYEEECWLEEGEEECEKWLVEEAIPAADWVELLDNEGAGIAFDKEGETYVAPSYAQEYTLTKSEGIFVLADPNGTRTEFSQNGETNEYQPSAISFQGTPGKASMSYEVAEGKRRLKMIIAPAAAGITCNPSKAEGSYAPETVGCRSLTFSYASSTQWGDPAGEDRLEAIHYHDASGSGEQAVAEYAYDSEGRLTKEWDPRISPALEEGYAYGKSSGSIGAEAVLTKLTPPGQEPWEFSYWGGRLNTVSRASLLESEPTATTTIYYGVPVTGEGAPHEMGPEAVAEWGQADYPVAATAIFPATDVPGDPPTTYAETDFSHATLHYLDPDGYEVNTASPSPPGVEGDTIATTEIDMRGNTVRELTPQNRLTALEDEDPVARSQQLDSQFTYNENGTEMLVSWGPLHEVRLEPGELVGPETVEGREHTWVSYDEGASAPKEGESWPRLPTRKITSVYAHIPNGGQTYYAFQKTITKTKYNWKLRKPTEEGRVPLSG